MAFRSLFCLFLSGFLRQVTLYLVFVLLNLLLFWGLKGTVTLKSRESEMQAFNTVNSEIFMRVLFSQKILRKKNLCGMEKSLSITDVGKSGSDVVNF